MVEYANFVIVPKDISNPWFQSAWLGCQAKAAELTAQHAGRINIACQQVGHFQPSPQQQALVLRELVTNPEKYNLTEVHGIAVSVLDEEITGEAIDFVFNAGLPIITFDSDAPKSKRMSYISTDNYAFGQELAKILVQLDPRPKPTRNYFGIITGAGPNLDLRVQGVRDRLLHDPLNPTLWREVDYSPLDCDDNTTLAVQLMNDYANDPRIGAILPVGGWPMFNATPWKDVVNQNRNITTVVGDSLQVQVELMSQGFVNGLVGQLPYQMGEFSAGQLFRMHQRLDRNETADEQTVLGTHMLEILRVPLVLPLLKVDQNYLGNLKIIAYVFFAAIAVSSLLVMGWVAWNRKTRVVRVSQPFFLHMIAFGTLTMGSTLIPLSMDDEHGNQRAADIACMSIPWLFFCGFATTFAAFFSKTWRIYQLMQGARRFRRVKVTVKDVMLPFVALMLANIIALTCWTVISPLSYVRRPHPGTDDWNRVISTYGTCQSTSGADGGSSPYLVILICTNIFVLIIANVYSYKSRFIHTEYSESRYIAVIMASFLEAALIGFPLAALLFDQPRPLFILLSTLTFVLCSAVLGFIFMPKYFALKEWRLQQREKEKAKANNIPMSDQSSGDKTEDEHHGMRCAVVRSSVVGRSFQQVQRSSLISLNKFRDLKKEISEMSIEDKRKLYQFFVSLDGLEPLEHEEVMDALEEHFDRQSNQPS